MNNDFDASYLLQDVAAFREENARLVEQQQRLELHANLLEQRISELEAELVWQEQAEKKDLSLQRQFSTLFDASPAALLLTNKYGDIEMLNQAAGALLDGQREALIGKNLRKFLQKESRYELVRFFRQAQSEQDKFRSQRVFTLHNETMFSLTVVRLSESGHFSGYYLLSPMVISLQELSAQSVRLQASILDQIREGMMVTNSRGRIIKVNQAFSEITGYSEQEVLDQSPSLLQSGRHTPSFYQQMWEEIQHHGWWAGEVWNRRKSGEVFPEWLQISRIHDQQTGQQFYVATFSDITERKLHQNQLDRLAFYDSLTGLPNRTLLTQGLDVQLARFRTNDPSQLAVLFLDLDKFKEVNDHYGHAEGDKVLREATQRIISRIRDTDLASRIGGDEFIIVLSRLQYRDDAFKVAEDLLAVLSDPFVTAKGRHHLSASIGLAFAPEQGDNVEDLMRRADAAMYRAKSKGRNAYQAFVEEDEDKLIESNQMLVRIRQAIQAPTRYITMHYQPIFQASAEPKVVHYEALIRLADDDGKLIYPNDFIELAEQHALIGQLGLGLFEKVCADIVAHQLPEQVRVAVNLSPVQFRSESLVDQLLEVAQSYNLSLQRFYFEVTETATMQNLQVMTLQLEQLKRLGACIMLDDFGTGYASLSMLKHLPVDVLKIDQGFVFELLESHETRSLVAAMIAMAKALELGVVAEGIEQQGHADWLIEHQVEFLQGYHLARPQAEFLP